MAEFLNMGGYAGFVWPSWGIALAVIIGVSVQSVIRSRRVRSALAAMEETTHG